MPAPNSRVLALVRLSGEIATKARPTRRQFVSQLVRNLRDALASEGVPAEIERRHDRLVLELPDDAAAPALARVFGVQSLSLAERVPAPDLASVVDAGAERFAEGVRGRRFAVRARRIGDDPGAGFRGREVEIALGERLKPFASRVDLSHPEVSVHVELLGGVAYFFTQTLAGEAGLPIGSEDRAVALVSGGFDSPVAAWQLLRRGVALDYVFCNLGGATHQRGTLRVMHALASRWCYGQHPRLHAVDFAELSAHLQRHTEPRYWQVILKRLMLRAGEAVANEIGARALVTGESVGQVSSQTLANLQTISADTALPILRPLVGANKNEIIALAHRIGTGALSAVVDEYCALVRRNPATSARLDVVREQEARLDPKLLEAALRGRSVLDLRGLDPDASGTPELEANAVPEKAVVIDLRTRGEYEAWHYPEALQLDFARTLAAFPSFSREQAYVLYCEYGLKSAHLAELMTKAGLRALHFRGGTRALRKWADQR